MLGLAARPTGYAPLLVTAYGTIKIHPETQAQIAAECPNWQNVWYLDRRRREFKRLRQIERDITALAEAVWMSGDDLTEI